VLPFSMIRRRGLISDVTAREELAKLMGSEVVRSTSASTPPRRACTRGASSKLPPWRDSSAPATSPSRSSEVPRNGRRPVGEERSETSKLKPDAERERFAIVAFLEFATAPPTVMVNNYDWFEPIGYLGSFVTSAVTSP
jgi:hypothetical protein